MPEEQHLIFRTITPLHIGGEQSKNLVEGLDFQIQQNHLKIFDQKKLVNAVGDMSQYCDALVKGANGISKLLDTRKIKLDEITSIDYPITGSAADLKRHIKNGATGEPFVPGSSIKGAVSSIIFSQLFKESGDHIDDVFYRKNWQGKLKPPQDHYLGTFEKGLMRFIHCSDVQFHSLRAFNAKVFNLQKYSGKFSGGWKHRHKTDNQFNDSEFTFAYECIPAGLTNEVTFRFRKNLFKMNQESGTLQGTYSKLSLDRIESDLFKWISDHTNLFLDKEISFFNRYPAQYSDNILASFENLKGLNNPKAPIFRMASGSGFHSITGDWLFNEYQINGIGKRNRGQFNGEDSAKSRRFAFDRDENSELRFYPMGFVQLMTPDYYATHYLVIDEKNREAEKIRIQEAQKAAAEETKQEDLRLEQKRMAEEEAKKPAWTDLTSLNIRQFKPVEAEVVGQEGLKVILKPFIRGYDQLLKVHYPAGFKVGTIVIINVQKTGNNLQHQGAPKVK